MSIFEFFQYIGTNIWLYGGSFILILSILVFVHEWGHYIIARLCGVRVEVFSIGFGKELFGFDDKAGTRWKFSMIPLGGYVKLFGDQDPASFQHSEDIEDDKTGKVRPLTSQEREVAFFAKPVWKRAAVVFAGPAINYIFAIILLTFLFSFNGKPVTPPSASAVIVGSSAERHGFLPHDYIKEIDGKQIVNFGDVRREMMIALDNEKHFVVDRQGESVDIYAKPERVEETDRFGFKHSRGLLGLISPRHAIDISNILSINGKQFQDVEAVRSALLKKYMDKVITVEVDHGVDGVDKLIVHPLSHFNETLADMQNDKNTILFLSDVGANNFVKYSVGESFVKSLEETYSITVSTLEALGQMIMGTRSAKELGGIIRIGAVAGDMAQRGLIAMIMFTALLSINLGLINLFPIPLLDGGHLVFYAVEAVIRRPVPDRIQEYAFRFGLVMLVCLMAFANLNDLIQLIL